MANAATIAGLAFSNAFVGVNHALAHAVGARFGIAHGRANAHLPAARAALQRLAAEQVHAGAGLLGLRRAGEVRADRAGSSGSAAATRRTRRERSSRASTSCSTTVGMPRSLAECGVTREEFDAALPDLARAAFMDPSMRTNPRIPLIRELVELLQAGYA